MRRHWRLLLVLLLGVLRRAAAPPGAPGGGAGAAGGTAAYNGSAWTQADEMATVYTHYAAGLVVNASKKHLDSTLPSVRFAAKHYGWVNETHQLPGSSAEMLAMTKEMAKPYVKKHIVPDTIDGKPVDDAHVDQLMDQTLSVMWHVWLPRVVKTLLLLLCCCCCAGLRYLVNRQAVKAGHQA